MTPGGPPHRTRGVSLIPSVECDSHEDVRYVESAAAYNKTEGELSVFVVKINWEQDGNLELDISGELI